MTATSFPFRAIESRRRRILLRTAVRVCACAVVLTGCGGKARRLPQWDSTFRSDGSRPQPGELRQPGQQSASDLSLGTDCTADAPVVVAADETVDRVIVQPALAYNATSGAIGAVWVYARLKKLGGYAVLTPGAPGLAVYDASAAPRAAARELSADARVSEVDGPRIAAMSDGFAVAWMDAAPSDRRPYVAGVSADGEPRFVQTIGQAPVHRAPIIARPAPHDGQPEPAAPDSVAVLWSRYRTADNSKYATELQGALISADGTFAREAPPLFGDRSVSAVAFFDLGQRLLGAWYEYAPVGDGGFLVTFHAGTLGKADLSPEEVSELEPPWFLDDADPPGRFQPSRDGLVVVGAPGSPGEDRAVGLATIPSVPSSNRAADTLLFGDLCEPTLAHGGPYRALAWMAGCKGNWARVIRFALLDERGRRLDRSGAPCDSTDDECGILRVRDPGGGRVSRLALVGSQDAYYLAWTNWDMDSRLQLSRIRCTQ